MIFRKCYTRWSTNCNGDNRLDSMTMQKRILAYFSVGGLKSCGIGIPGGFYMCRVPDALHRTRRPWDVSSGPFQVPDGVSWTPKNYQNHYFIVSRPVDRRNKHKNISKLNLIFIYRPCLRYNYYTLYIYILYNIMY